jgi:hypothetical protein
MRRLRHLSVIVAGALLATVAFAPAAFAAEPTCTLFGTDGDDVVAYVPAGEVYCGGKGNDSVDGIHGTFIGGPGDDYLRWNDGAFYGGPGDDEVSENWKPFAGGPGMDFVLLNHSTGQFAGGAGADWVFSNAGRFVGGAGFDEVLFDRGGTFVPGSQKR